MVPSRLVRSRQVFGAILLLAIGYFSVSLTQTANAHKQLSKDLAEVQHIKHGLLSASQWASKLSIVLKQHIKVLTTTKSGREELRTIITELVDAALTSMEDTALEEYGSVTLPQIPMLESIPFGGNVRDAVQKWASEKLREAIKSGMEGLRKLGPRFTEILLTKISDQHNTLSKSILAQLSKHASAASTHVDRSALDDVMTRNACEPTSLRTCERKLIESIHGHAGQLSTLPIYVLALFYLFLITCLFTRSTVGPTDIVLLITGSFILLIGGILNPMMSIEAKLDTLSVSLLEQVLVFENQVIFFQSKSINDVVVILLQKDDVGMMVVGILIATFSIGFPCAKLLASLIYYYDLGALRENRLIHFFALKSGKWSMADVFVIAIFMAYIAFGGLIDSQLSALAETKSTSLEVLPSPNGTKFQPGLFLFTGFCFASLLVGGLIEQTAKPKRIA